MPLRPPAGFIRPGFDPLKNPNAPTIGAASAGNASASVAFTPPSNVGGSAISEYYAVSDPEQVTVSGASSPINVTGLTNGTPYTFTVWALNTYGPGPYSGPSGSVTPDGSVGLFAGGDTQTNTISKINIASTGNATTFGQLTQARYDLGSASSSVRGLWAGGYTSLAPNNRTNVIDYVTIVTTGDALDFGDLTVTSEGNAGSSSEVRAVFATGYNVVIPAATNVINYVTIATTGDAIDFGDLSVVRTYVASAASSTRALFSGGIDSSFSNKTNVIDFITIASAGNATDFGDLSQAVQRAAGVSSSTGAFFGGGNTGAGLASPTSRVDKVTIATAGNATDFATLTSARYGPGGASSSTRATFGGGSTGSVTSTIDFFTMATGGSAASFGSLVNSVSSLAACSNAHGGL